MTLNGLLIFAGIYVTALATPGPGIAAIVARSLGHGLKGIGFLIAGFVAGDLTLMVLAATGLAVLVQAFGPLLLAIKLAGAAYLVFLAWKLWNAPTNVQAAGESTRENSPSRLFLGGLSLTIGNPKAIVFFMAILPTVVDLRTMDAWKLTQIAAVIGCLMPLVLGAYAIAAARAKKLFTSPDSIRKVNRATAVVMAGAAAVVASS